MYSKCCYQCWSLLLYVMTNVFSFRRESNVGEHHVRIDLPLNQDDLGEHRSDHKLPIQGGLFMHRCYREREMFYLTMHSTHSIYGYMASDIWLRTILIVREETRCRHIGYCYRLTARVLLYAPSHRQDNTYHSLCYTSRGTLAGTRNSSMGPPHEGSIRRLIAPWANALPLSQVPLPHCYKPDKPKNESH